MTVYGFGDKQTARELQDIARNHNLGGKERSRSYRGKGYRVLNKTGSTIPPHGIAFIQEINTQIDNDKNFVFPVYNISNLPAGIPKDMFLVNGRDEITQGGTMLADQMYYKIKVNATTNIDPAKKYGVKPNSYELTDESEAVPGGPLFIPVSAPNSDAVVIFKQYIAAETGTSFFLTRSGGMVKAISKFQPAWSICERMRWDSEGGEIKELDPREYVKVYNHTLSDVGADKVIQAKKIDGDWFIDVEPCAGGDG